MLSRALPSVRRRALVMAIKRAHHPGAFGEKDTRFRQCLTSGAAGQLLTRSREAPELAGSKRGRTAGGGAPTGSRKFSHFGASPGGLHAQRHYISPPWQTR